MKDINKIALQMQSIKRTIKDLKTQMTFMKFTGCTSNGDVSITLNGYRQMINLDIRTKLIDAKSKLKLEALIIKAYHKALGKTEKFVDKRVTNQLTDRVKAVNES